MQQIDTEKLMFSNKKLFTMILPLMLNAVLSIMVGFVDSVMVSSTGEAAVSAVSLVDAINITVVGLLASLATGGSIVTAQYLGAGDQEQAKASARQLIYLVVGLALLCMIPMLLLHRQVLSLIYGSVAPDVAAEAQGYFFWTLLGYPFVALNNASSAIMRARTKNAKAVSITICSNLVNVIGNAVLIYGFRLGAAGAGMATTIGRMAATVVSVYMLQSQGQFLRLRELFPIKPDVRTMKRVLGIGIGTGMENFLFKFGKLLLSSVIATLGTAAIAANSVANTVGNFGWEIVGALGSVMMIVVARCIGAEDIDQAKYYVKKILTIGFCMMLILFGGIFLLRDQIVLLFDFTPEVRALCAEYIAIMVAVTVLGTHCFVFVPKAALRAAGDIRYAFIVSVTSMFVMRVGVGILLCVVLKMGLLGIWLGMGADFLFQTLCNFARLRSGKWLKKKLI